MVAHRQDQRGRWPSAANDPSWGHIKPLPSSLFCADSSSKLIGGKKCGQGMLSRKLTETYTRSLLGKTARERRSRLPGATMMPVSSQARVGTSISLASLTLQFLSSKVSSDRDWSCESYCIFSPILQFSGNCPPLTRLSLPPGLPSCPISPYS